MVGQRRHTRLVVLALLVVILAAPAGLAQAALVWQTETVDGADSAGWFSSLALDTEDRAHISYDDRQNGILKYARNTGTGWQIETVDATGVLGAYPSLALDSENRPHIAYQVTDDLDLKYAHYTGVDWEIETLAIDQFIGSGPSLALDANDLPHISYQDASDESLKYARYTGTDWQVEVVDSPGTTGWFPSMALDTQGHPHISYFDSSTSTLKYAYHDGSNWQIEIVVDVGGGPMWISLALGPEDQPHISYYSVIAGFLEYAHRDGTGWQTEIVDTPGTTGTFNSLAVDSQNRPHISYFDATNFDLKYAYNTGTGWQIEMIGSEGNVGWKSSLALDSDEQPHISYHDLNNGTLKYARGLLNRPPSPDAGGPYSGVEGSSIALDGGVEDLDEDPLTSSWSYTSDDADPGTTCTFADATQLDTTFTCTDDGTFTVTLQVNDGVNPAVTDSATVTVANADPTISEVTSTLEDDGATITVEASDPGANDVLTYAFDCTNDGDYELDAGQTNYATCPLSPQQNGSYLVGVQVSDDDGGVATETVAVVIPIELCANNYTGVLRYTADCQSYETRITIPDPASPVTVCASTANGLLRVPLAGSCSGQQISYVLPEDGPLNICINGYTLTMRVVGDLGQCANHEFGRVLAPTDAGETSPPGSR